MGVLGEEPEYFSGGTNMWKYESNYQLSSYGSLGHLARAA